MKNFKNKDIIRFPGYTLLFSVGLYCIRTFDHSIFLFIHPREPNIISYVMLFLTVLANGLIVLLFISLFYQKRKEYFLPSTASLVITGILINLLKSYFAFTRPVYHFTPEEIMVLGNNLSNYSFPSGHSGAAMVLAFFMIGGSRNAGFIALGFLCGILGCLSRVYIGVHFPSDIWAGGWIGYWVSKFTFGLFQKKEFLRKTKDFKWNRMIAIVLGICCAVAYLFLYPARNEQMDIIMYPLLCGVLLLLMYLFIREVCLMRRKAS